MSKTDLRKFVHSLSKEQLEVQILVLYDKFTTVKTYYDFVFKPNEKKLAAEARVKIAVEYYPAIGKKPKQRRSTSQKIIKHFLSLGVDPFIIADLMLFSVEIAQTYNNEKPSKQDAFYKSILGSTQLAFNFISNNGILYEFKNRLSSICLNAKNQQWPNCCAFAILSDKLD